MPLELDHLYYQGPDNAFRLERLAVNGRPIAPFIRISCDLLRRNPHDEPTFRGVLVEPGARIVATVTNVGGVAASFCLNLVIRAPCKQFAPMRKVLGGVFDVVGLPDQGEGPDTHCLHCGFARRDHPVKSGARRTPLA